MSPKPHSGKPLIFRTGESPDEGETARVSDGLGMEIAANFGPPETSPLAINAYDDGELAGGLSGIIHWRWLYIQQFWIAELWRGRGAGRDLLHEAETQARARQCVGIYLDTFDPGAAKFYERCGFARCGEIADFPPGHRRTFLQMKL